MKIGKGIILENKTALTYQGTMPFKAGDQVVVIKEAELEEIVKNKIQLLLETGKQMPTFLYNYFPDEIDYTASDGTVHKLYFERKIYGDNLKDMMLIRYVSYDQACEEEDFNDKK